MGSVFGVIGEETPQYTVIKTIGENVEIRRYKKSVAIETDVNGHLNSKENGNSFRRLAGYIGVMTTAENERKQPIAMTAPVVNYEVGGDSK